MRSEQPSAPSPAAPVIIVPAELDASNAGQVSQNLAAALAAGVTVLVADLTATVLCDSAGARMLAIAHRRAAVNGAQLRLVVTAAPVLRMFTLTGLNRVLAIYPSLDLALAGDAPQQAGSGGPSGDAQSPRQNVADPSRRQTPHARTQAAVGDAHDLAAETGSLRAGRAQADRWPAARRGSLTPGEHARLSARLLTMPVIEQAKGILIAQLGGTLEEAAEHLQLAARRRNLPLHEAAAEIVARTACPGPRPPSGGPRRSPGYPARPARRESAYPGAPAG
jgi:anti-sigma B factor antagonist